MFKNNFLDLVWENLSSQPSSNEYLFEIDLFTNIKIPQFLGDSLTSNVNGVATSTYLLYPQYLRSNNGDYVLMIERNGNLIIWQKNAGTPWMANTHNDGNGLVIQNDGNLVVYGYGTQFDAGDPKWTTDTYEAAVNTGSSIRTIQISDDGKFKIYSGTGTSNFIKQFP